jgi:O-antigen ligase
VTDSGSSARHTPAPPLLTALCLAARVAVGSWLAWSVVLAIAAPELPWSCSALAILVASITLWRPLWGLVLTTAIVPMGTLLADTPLRASELFAWAFLAAWLVALWRPLSASPWPRVVSAPALLFGAALVGSWLSFTVAGAPGVPWAAMPQFLFQSIPRDHLIFSSPEAETWTLLQSMTGLGLFLAALGITRTHAGSIRTVTATIGITVAALAAATPLVLVWHWAQQEYATWFIQRFLQHGERFSLPMTDVNAAGSLYVIGFAVGAAYVVSGSRQRGLWAASLCLLVPALWLAGSRSAYLGVSGVAGLIVIVRSGWTTRLPVLLSAAALAAGLSLAVSMESATSGQGDIRQSASLRSQFLQTSARMFATSPLFGVGIGHYFGRSGEFMTPTLREIYGNENAHNYFAQEFSELGLAGGLPFVWLVVAAAWVGWRRLRESPDDTATLALTAGTAGYLLTCLTGHPLLVPEAALPFWIALGTVAATARAIGGSSPAIRVACAAGCVLIAAGVGRAAIASQRVAEVPPDSGFHQVENDDGDTFRWMTRHAVTYIPDGTGFLRLRLRAQTRPMIRPLVIETSIGGRVADRREVRPGAWVTIDVPARPTGTPFRRVDFRANQVWTQEVRLGQRIALRPVTVMAEEITWMPLR